MDNKDIFIPRLKSFAWRLGGMAGVAILAFSMDNIGLLNLPPEVVVILGLIVGELTKWINTVLLVDNS